MYWPSLQQYKCPLCKTVLESAFIEGIDYHACTNHLCGYKINTIRFNEIVKGMDNTGVVTCTARARDGVLFNIIG